MKIVPYILSGLLVVVAAGRFQAEAEVRQRESDLYGIKSEIKTVEQEIADVQLDVEVLESASRLSELNNRHLTLATVRAEQLVDERDFARLVGTPVPVLKRKVPLNSDVIGNAIGMADLRLAEQVTEKGQSE